MHLPTIFASFATLLTAATAVPLNARDAASNNIPTPAKAVSAVASVTQSQSATATMTPVGAYSCPQKQHKQCCQSLQQTSKDLMKPIGDLVPIVGGLEISSKISFQCKGKKMTDDEPPDNCKDPGYTPMCCKAEATQGGLNQCKPFGAVKKEYYKSFGYGQESQVDVINDAVS